MHAPGRVVAMAGEAERVVCLGTLPDGRPCRRVLAVRAADGTVVPADRDIWIYKIDPDRRAWIRCPSCGRRVRVKAKRAA